MKKILVAGATGYLGSHIVKELKNRNYWVRVLIRNENQKKEFKEVDDFFVGQITDIKSLEGVTKNIDIVFSSVGITRQKDGLTYMDVDYKANSNLLVEAKKTGVESFMYISAINGNNMRELKIFEAKERFVDELVESGMNYTIVRPNGFFSDMGDFLDMAKKGTVYLFGHGNYKLNPIHGEDLANFCVDKLGAKNEQFNVGGPHVMSQNKLAELALKAWDKKIKIIHLPDWIRKVIILGLRTFTSSKTYGPYEFFLTAMASDNIASQYGEHQLEDFFKVSVRTIKNE